METITGCYSYSWLKRVTLDEKKICLGTQKVCEIIIKCARGKNFSWVTDVGIAGIGGQHLRTVERNIKKAIAAGVIVRGFNEELQKKGFYLLPHPELVAHMVKRGIKFVIEKLFGSGVETRRTDSSDEEIKNNNELPFTGNLPVTLPNSLYKGDKNNTPPLPPKVLTGENPDSGLGVVSEEQREIFINDEQKQVDAHSDYCEQEKKQGPPVFTAVISELEQKQDFIPLVAILKSCIVQEKGERLQIETDKYCLKTIKNHLLLLEDVFQQYGITKLSISAMSDEQQQRYDERLLFQERQEKARRLHEERLAAEQAAEAERRKIADLTMKDQFDLLAKLYPQAANGFREMRPWDYRPAWSVFRELYKTGEIPSVFELLQIIKKQKKSTGWNRDNGRWIPGLWKWLNNRPWWNNEYVASKF